MIKNPVTQQRIHSKNGPLLGKSKRVRFPIQGVKTRRRADSKIAREGWRKPAKTIEAQLPK